MKHQSRPSITTQSQIRKIARHAATQKAEASVPKPQILCLMECIL